MAHQTQAIAQTITRIQPFADRPMDENNIYPRRRLIAQSSTAITAKDALDTKTIDLTLTLPPNFAYALDQLFARLGSATSIDSDNYTNLAFCSLDFTVGPIAEDVFFTLESPGDVIDDVDGAAKMYALAQEQRFTEVFFNQAGVSPVMVVSMNDIDAVNNTDALNLRFYASFLEYDIRQTDDVVVNAPMPVHLR